MIVKSVLRYLNDPNTVEATWVEMQQFPDIQVPEHTDDEGQLVPAQTIPGEVIDAVVKCRAYHATQLNELRTDLGPDAAQYESLLAQVEAEYIPEPAPIQVPSAVTMRQARLALLNLGLLANVDSAISALPSPQKEAAKIEWEYSQEVQRHNGFVAQLAPILGLDSNQLDNLFIEAKKL